MSFSPRRRPDSKPRQSNRLGSKGVGDLGWDPVATWYDKLVGETGSDYHRNVILPAALAMLAPGAGEAVIDVCCGQGVFARHLLDAGVSRYTGIDASPRLVAAAKARYGNDARTQWVVADVCQPDVLRPETHDAAACLMAVHDVADLDALVRNMARALKPAGRAVLVFMHPCFRIPRQTHWGWDSDQKIQFRRIDAYKTPSDIPIATHPGKDDGAQTLFRHRTLSELLTSIGRGGLAVTGCRELYSHRRSQASGPFSKAEHKAAEEIPLFLALQAVRV